MSPLQNSLVAKATKERGAAPSYAFDHENRQLLDACNSEGIQFVTLPMETLGGWDSRALKDLNKLGGQLAHHTGRGLRSPATSIPETWYSPYERKCLSALEKIS